MAAGRGRGAGVDADAEVDGRVAADELVGVEGGEDGAQRGCGVDVVGALQAAPRTVRCGSWAGVTHHKLISAGQATNR
jgi:hypothetical protein